MLGSAIVWLSFVVWSLPLAAIGVLLIFVSGLMGVRPFMRNHRRWYDDLLWLLLAIAPGYRLATILLGPKDVPGAALVGAGLFCAWVLLLIGTTLYLWRTGDRAEASAQSPIPAK